MSREAGGQTNRLASWWRSRSWLVGQAWWELCHLVRWRMERLYCPARFPCSLDVGLVRAHQTIRPGPQRYFRRKQQYCNNNKARTFRLINISKTKILELENYKSGSTGPMWAAVATHSSLMMKPVRLAEFCKNRQSLHSRVLHVLWNSREASKKNYGCDENTPGPSSNVGDIAVDDERWDVCFRCARRSSASLVRARQTHDGRTTVDVTQNGT